MRIRRYLTHLILIGAAAATMGAAPAVMVTPAPPSADEYRHRTVDRL